MNAQHLKWIAALLGAVVVMLLWSWRRQTPDTSAGGKEGVVATAPNSHPPPASLAEIPQGGISAALAGAVRELSSAEGKGAALDRLRLALKSSSTKEAAAAIRQFLDTKTDTATGREFKLGGHGSLAEAPTLRTFLLDQLAQLDPAAAAAYARTILASSDSPDDWAIALRNLARGDASPDGRALVEAKTAELLRHEAWQQNPSIGYLEAFDTAVFLGGTNLLPALGELVRKKDNQAVAHAAFMTLDRLAINQPTETLAALAQHPEWMQGREETRANFFARADIGDAIQRRLVETYLLDAARSPNELSAFAEVFPNGNFFVSQNLLTEVVTPDGTMLAQRDRVSLVVVNEWMAAPKFERVKPALQQMQQRLLEFTRQASGAKQVRPVKTGS